MTRTYKKHRADGKKDQVSVHLHIDCILYAAYSKLENKTRFVNDAIREKMERENLA